MNGFEILERPFVNELLLVFDNRCDEPRDKDSDNNNDVDGGVV